MFQYDFIQRAFIAGLAISFITPILGMLLILRRQAMMADSLSHVSLAGVALGIVLGVNPTWSTLLVVVLAALIIEYLRSVYENFSELSIAIMNAAGMAIAFVLVSLNSYQSNVQIDQYLFGSILLISNQELKLLIGLAAVVLVLYMIFRRPLYVLSFDEATAKTNGLPVRAMSVCFSLLTGVAISVMLPIMGALLVSALIVVPSATAIKISDSFNKTIIYGIIINMIGIGLGIYLSFVLDTPPGATITLNFIFIFIVVSICSYLAKRLRRKE